MRTLISDVKFAVRTLLKSPSFTIIAVLTLALGIGANTAIFSLVDAALLRPLPYADAVRLVHLWETSPRRQFHLREASYPNFSDWQRETRTIESLAGYNRTNFTLTGSGDAVRIGGTRVTANFFSTLGVQPVLGRDFRPEEEATSAPRVVIVTHGFWKDRLAGDPEALGRAVLLGGVPYTVIGVLPPEFRFPLNSGSDAWVTLSMTDDQRTRRGFHWLQPIARLRAGVSIDQARAEMSAIAANLARQYADTNTGTDVRLRPLREEISGEIRPVVLILLGAVSLMLLIACANIAGLLLARSAARQREFAIRVALGAGPPRLLRQLLTESALLAGAGGIAGVLLAGWGLSLLTWLLARTPGFGSLVAADISLHPRVLGFTLGISMLSALIFGLLPAFSALRVPLNESLKESGRAISGLRRGRARSVLVVTEVALALVLLAGTGLLLRSLNLLLQVDPGFDPRNLMTMRVALPASRYSSAEQVVSFYQRLEDRLAALPGVSVGVVDEMPLTHDGNTVFVHVEGRPAPLPGQEIESVTRTGSPRYFEMMKIPLLAGRTFNGSDNATAPMAVVLSETLARRLFPGEDPVGRSVVIPVTRIAWRVVGVVADVRLGELDREIRPVLYTCGLQDPSRSSAILLRSTTDRAALTAAARAELKALDPELPLYGVRTMEETLELTAGVSTRRSVTVLMTVFAGLAALLAAVGLYGLLSQTVVQRTQEIGIRLAMGASLGKILRLVIGQGMRLTLAGVVVGWVAALAATRLMATLLFGVSATDAVSYLVAGGLLALVALVACWIPARQAAKTDPLTALRYE